MNAAMPERQPATEQISGVIERVTFHNDDSGFCVLRIKTKGHPQVAGIGVPSGGDPASQAALHAVCANCVQNSSRNKGDWDRTSG
jgi:hypothetical protein